MSERRSHPPHTRARSSQAGLALTGAMSVALIVGVVTSAGATPSIRNRARTNPPSGGVASTAQRVADTAQEAATSHAPMNGLQIAGQVRRQTELTQLFYKNLAWDTAVAKTLAWDNAVAKNLAWDNAVAAYLAHQHPGAATSGAAGMTGSVGSMFSCIRHAESGGNYSAVNSSSGAGGAYQFMPSTWASLGGSGLPENAPPAEQDAMAMKLYQRDGWSPWAGDPCVR